MRFMLIVKATPQAEAGTPASPQLRAELLKFTEELARAGVLLAGERLDPSARGARIAIRDGKRTVVEGPFAPGPDLIAGFWILQVKSREEALEWARRCPSPDEHGDAELELRQVVEAADAMAPERVAREAGLADKIARPHG